MPVHTTVHVQHRHLSEALRSMLDGCLHVVFHVLQPATVTDILIIIIITDAKIKVTLSQ